MLGLLEERLRSEIQREVSQPVETASSPELARLLLASAAAPDAASSSEYPRISVPRPFYAR
jgi:hypothetical protein